MKKLRILLATVAMASAFVVAGAGPAQAKCTGPINVCVLICEVGNSNKYTADLFRFCEVW